MDEKNPTIRERLAVVETELKHVKSDIGTLQSDVDAHFEQVDSRLAGYNKSLGNLASTVNLKLRGSLSGGEKVSIIVALITSISAIVIACIK